MTTVADRIANALLYEGYLLYPYRRSAIKNRQRFNFGVLLPPNAVDPAGTDRSSIRAEFLIEESADCSLSARLRFLHLLDRGPIGGTGERWHEAIERTVPIGFTLARLRSSGPRSLSVGFGAAERHEGDDLLRTEAIEVEVQCTAIPVEQCLTRISVEVANRTGAASDLARDQLLLRSLISTHVILEVTNGSFVSLLDPPPHLAVRASECRNDGVWPALIGEGGARNTLLASPIILYDYPCIAPESAGDLFDATEIDEILSLRILTLTDEEKQEVRRSDRRARELLDRTEALTADEFLRLHGVLRQPDSVGPVPP